MFRDPLSITLIFVIVVALALAGVVGAELYARHVGDQRVAAATSCVVQDGVKVSFGPRPFLLQHLTGHYSGIHITTDGNQLREAKGMKADIVIDDVRVADNPNSAGTIGSLTATIDWSADGIKRTIQDSIPLIGSFVSGVTTNPSDGTIELDGMLGTIVTEPQVVDGGIALKVVQLTGLGFTLPREAVQPALDAFSAQLTNDYPLDVRADSIEVTDSGVISKFSSQNAAMPAGGQGDDACFAGALTPYWPNDAGAEPPRRGRCELGPVDPGGDREVEDGRRDVDRRTGIRDVDYAREATFDRCRAEEQVGLLGAVPELGQVVDRVQARPAGRTGASRGSAVRRRA